MLKSKEGLAPLSLAPLPTISGQLKSHPPWAHPHKELIGSDPQAPITEGLKDPYSHHLYRPNLTGSNPIQTRVFLTYFTLNSHRSN